MTEYSSTARGQGPGFPSYQMPAMGRTNMGCGHKFILALLKAMIKRPLHSNYTDQVKRSHCEKFGKKTPVLR